MLFKQDKKANTKYADIACWVTFTFWGIILIINSLSEILTKKPLIKHSLTILLFGLFLFFLVEFSLRFYKRKVKN